MRTAIFHSFMDNIGGAEVVTLTLARALGADVYTTNISGEKIAKMGFGDVLPRIHSIGRVPIRAPFRHQATFWRFRRLSLADRYDRYVISGDWAMSAAVNHRPNIWYAHSPINEIWTFRDFVREKIVPRWQRPLFDIWVWFNRRLTLRYARDVDRFVCNSENTRGRIARYYGVEAKVIYPPVPTSRYRSEPARDYWLSVNRLFTHKRVEMQLEAFAAMPDKKLIIVGSYEAGASQFETYRKKIEATKPPNVEIRSWVSQEELLGLYASCRGFVTTSRDEDFGMTAVEAMAAGKPVVAAAEGGYLESVLDHETGILVESIDAGKLGNAVIEIERRLALNPLAFRDACLARAKNFDEATFVREMSGALENLPVATDREHEK